MGALGAIPAGLSVVEGGTIPYQPRAAEKRRENLENWLKLDPAVKCYMPGIPRATYMPFPFQIVQTPKSILFAYEFASTSRVVRMDRPGSEALAPSWMGYGLGRWEGETLVVDVTAQVPDTWFDTSGNFHSEELRVEERYTPTGPNTLLYEATIVDTGSVHTTVEDQHAALPPPREERTDPRVQVRSVCRRGGVRPSPAEGPSAPQNQRPSRAGQLRRQQP